jgi:hypothetical protein
MLLEYVRVLHFWLRFYGSAKHFCVILLKKSIWFYKCARKSLSADRHDHNRPSFASWLIFSNAAYFYGSPLLCSGLWLTVYIWSFEREKIWCTWAPVLLVVKNYKIYSIDTYICSEYSCKVSVEFALYFEPQRKTKKLTTYRLRLLSEIYPFCVAQKHIFLWNFYRTFGMSICMSLFNFRFF